MSWELTGVGFVEADVMKKTTGKETAGDHSMDEGNTERVLFFSTITTDEYLVVQLPKLGGMYTVTTLFSKGLESGWRGLF